MSKGDKMLTRDDLYHMKYGSHSGIPDCCIAYFITDWQTALNARNGHWKRIYDLGWGYVPCPTCLSLKRKARVIDCDLECGGQHQKDFTD